MAPRSELAAKSLMAPGQCGITKLEYLLAAEREYTVKATVESAAMACHGKGATTKSQG